MLAINRSFWEIILHYLGCLLSALLPRLAINSELYKSTRDRTAEDLVTLFSFALRDSPYNDLAVTCVIIRLLLVLCARADQSDVMKNVT